MENIKYNTCNEELRDLMQFLEMNNCEQNEFFRIVHDTVLQFVLSQVCETLSHDESCLKKIKEMYFKETDNKAVAKKIAKMICDINLPEKDAVWFDKCLHARLNKKSTRAVVPDSVKSKLLEKQNHKCACCGATISMSDCYDHIIPWKYVGDELEDNGQMLCKTCNLKKSSKVYFQLQHKLISTCDWIGKRH